MDKACQGHEADLASLKAALAAGQPGSPGEDSGQLGHRTELLGQLGNPDETVGPPGSLGDIRQELVGHMAHQGPSGLNPTAFPCKLGSKAKLLNEVSQQILKYPWPGRTCMKSVAYRQAFEVSQSKRLPPVKSASVRTRATPHVNTAFAHVAHPTPSSSIATCVSSGNGEAVHLSDTD